MKASDLPRLLYFNGPWDYLGERMRKSYIEPFHALLAQDFEVISIEGNRDFRVEVEKHRPDVVLFHTGSEAPMEPEVTIANTEAFPEIPRMAYIFRDPFSPSRMMTMNRLKAWRPDQVFTDFRPSDSPAPFFKDTMYLPWWVDDTVCRDYGEAKTLDITLTGSGWLSKCIYLWRHEISCAVLPRFPVFHAPSLGNRQTNHDYSGERYSRLLNRSHFSAGCGTVSRYLTMKLLEIPASRCCLIAEEIEVLKAIGFKDGVNCVFATGKNVVSKVEALLNQPDRLDAITQAGYDLVHQRHTLRNRRMFAEWFRLWKNKQPGQRIAQTHPFEPLRLCEPGVDLVASNFPTENPLTEALVEGYALLAASRWTMALAKFEWIIGIVPCVAEARLGATLCLIRLGRTSEATPHLRYNLTLLTRHFGYKHPDPIDLSFIAILCVRMKDAPAASQLLGQYGQLKHPALNAIRWIFGKSNAALALNPVFQIREGDESSSVETVHILPQRSFADWVALFMTYLRLA